MTKNNDLTTASFLTERADVQNAFKKLDRVVILPVGLQLFKLTKGKAEAGSRGVTGWWSPVKPFMQDSEGALGRFQQAKLNGIDMAAMVRYMSAVCVDWNDLDNYVQVELTTPIKAYWGTFAPQPKFSASDVRGADLRTAHDARVNPGAVLPDVLGALEAWQFYIPNLADADIKRGAVIPAHDMRALALYFGLLF